MRMAFRVGDNDYMSCLLPLFQTLLRAYEWNPIPFKSFSKEDWCRVIIDLIPSHYRIFQGGLDEKSVSYLTSKVTPKNIFLEEEVFLLIQETGWGNSEVFILDSESGVSWH